ncbi:cupin domain-containing protein [Kribbella sp. GL6]|uniref:cupin domain-containing protein n=1 Tax=Kribbella sp. GL6 TaxID=3419765 RepID=UPI003CFCB8F1
MTQLAPQDAAVYNHVDMLCRILLDGRDTDGAFALVEERAAVGAMTPRHVHSRESETLMVLEGALEAWSEGRSTEVEAGSLIYLPPGRAHAFRVVSAAARYYNLITPSGFESFFRDSGVLLTQEFAGELPIPGPVPPEGIARLQAVLDPLGCTITGPPPFDS